MPPLTSNEIEKQFAQKLLRSYPADNYLFKISNVNVKTMCDYLKLTLKTTEQRHWRRSGVFNVNCEQISHIVVVFSLLILNK